MAPGEEGADDTTIKNPRPQDDEGAAGTTTGKHSAAKRILARVEEARTATKKATTTEKATKTKKATTTTWRSWSPRKKKPWRSVSFPCLNGHRECYSKTQRMPPEETLHKYQLMHWTRILLERHKMWHVAAGGTLLGAVRNKGIIPHDDDLDLNFIFGQFDISEAFLDDLKKNDMALYTRETPGPVFYRVHHLDKPGSVDLFGLEKHGDKLTYPKNWHPARLKTEWPASIAEEGGLIQWPFGSTTVPAPPSQITEAFLDNELDGPEWRTVASCGDPKHFKQGSTFHECFGVQDVEYDVTGRALPDGPLEDPL